MSSWLFGIAYRKGLKTLGGWLVSSMSDQFLRYSYMLVFGLWFLFSITWQFERCRERSRLLRRINFLNLLPIWTFFAPNPGIYDTHVVFRDKLADGSLTMWQEVPLLEIRRPFHCIWNPLKRRSKLVADALAEIRSVKRNAVRNDVDDEVLMNQVKFSKGYLILLNIACGHEKLADSSVSRQFVILDATHLGGRRNLIPLFHSAFHQL